MACAVCGVVGLRQAKRALPRARLNRGERDRACRAPGEELLGGGRRQSFRAEERSSHLLAIYCSRAACFPRKLPLCLCVNVCVDGIIWLVNASCLAKLFSISQELLHARSVSSVKNRGGIALHPDGLKEFT